MRRGLFALLLVGACSSGNGGDGGSQGKPSDAGAGCSPACSSDLTCLAGACVPISCTSNADCPAGLACLSGYCASADCQPTCPSGQVCIDGICLQAAHSITCAAPYRACSGPQGPYCANLQQDSLNCGACGSSCDGGSCTNGACAACPAGQSACDGGCVSFATSQSDCGACGHGCPAQLACAAGDCGPVACADGGSCPAGLACLLGYCASEDCAPVCPTNQVCIEGTCLPIPGSVSCTSPYSARDGAEGPYCANLEADGLNCGSCGARCDGGTCSSGACVDCASGQSVCGQACVDLMRDPDNCGSCGTGCGGGACTQGACACPGSEPVCAKGCTDTTHDPQNCSACGAVCAASQICNGNCQPCPTGFAACWNDDTCRLLSLDVSACGGCANFCNQGSVCADGGCVTPGLAPDPYPFLGTGCAAAGDGRIYLVDGETANENPVQATEVYSPDTNLWTSPATLPVNAGNLGLTTLPAGLIAVYTYFDMQEQVAAEAFDIESNGWSQLSTPPMGLSDIAMAADLDGGAYTFGGFDQIGPRGYVADTWRYDIATDTWSQGHAMQVARQDLAAVLGPDGRIYAIGGTNGTNGLSDVEAYTPGTDSWTTLAALPTPRGFLGAAVGTDGRIYAIGGTTDLATPLAVVEAYDIGSDSWTAAAPMPTPRFGLCVAAAPDGRIYALAGGVGGGTSVSNTEAFSPGAGTWAK